MGVCCCSDCTTVAAAAAAAERALAVFPLRLPNIRRRSLAAATASASGPSRAMAPPPFSACLSCSRRCRCAATMLWNCDESTSCDVERCLKEGSMARRGAEAAAAAEVDEEDCCCCFFSRLMWAGVVAALGVRTLLLPPEESVAADEVCTLLASVWGAASPTTACCCCCSGADMLMCECLLWFVFVVCPVPLVCEMGA